MSSKPESTESNGGLDLLGIRPIAEAVNKVTGATVDGVSAFLSRICLPAAEEYGLYLRDRVSLFRSRNIEAIGRAAERKLAKNGPVENIQAHPRLIGSILEHGAWIDDAEVQDMWAGLLASSCTETGDDDSNLLFISLLDGLTRLQAKILRYACENARKEASPAGLIQAKEFSVSLNSLFVLSHELDVQRLDREIDHLRELGLLHLNAGFDGSSKSLSASLTPSPLALHMYVRCQGSRLSPIEFFGIARLGDRPAAPGDAPASLQDDSNRDSNQKITS